MKWNSGLVFLLAENTSPALSCDKRALCQYAQLSKQKHIQVMDVTYPGKIKRVGEFVRDNVSLSELRRDKEI